MGSKLKKKSKNKQARRDLEWEKRVNNTDKLIEESYYNLRLIAYQILHDKFGFGQKRIIRLERTIDEYMAAKAEGGLHTDELLFFMKEKCNIDVKDEANKVPFRERFAIVKFKIHAESQKSAGMYLLDSICNYFALLGVCLKTQFKFSANQIKKAYWHIRDYINTLSRYKQFELTIDMIAESLMEEVKYCDARYV